MAMGRKAGWKIIWKQQRQWNIRKKKNLVVIENFLARTLTQLSSMESATNRKVFFMRIRIIQTKITINEPDVYKNSKCVHMIRGWHLRYSIVYYYLCVITSSFLLCIVHSSMFSVFHHLSESSTDMQCALHTLKSFTYGYRCRRKLYYVYLFASFRHLDTIWLTKKYVCGARAHISQIIPTER